MPTDANAAESDRTSIARIEQSMWRESRALAEANFAKADLLDRQRRDTDATLAAAHDAVNVSRNIARRLVYTPTTLAEVEAMVEVALDILVARDVRGDDHVLADGPAFELLCSALRGLRERGEYLVAVAAVGVAA